MDADGVRLWRREYPKLKGATTEANTTEVLDSFDAFKANHSPQVIQLAHQAGFRFDPNTRMPVFSTLPLPLYGNVAEVCEVIYLWLLKFGFGISSRLGSRQARLLCDFFRERGFVSHFFPMRFGGHLLVSVDPVHCFLPPNPRHVCVQTCLEKFLPLDVIVHMIVPYVGWS